MTAPPGQASLSNEEILRYSRHLIIPEVGIEGQLKLKAAKVLLVGTGGLGAPLAGKRLVEADGGGRGCGGLGANGQEGGCAEDERQGGAAEAARREWHRKNANSRKAGTRDVGTRG